MNINALNAHTNPNKTAFIDMGLDITSLDQLNYIIGKLGVASKGSTRWTGKSLGV